MRPQLWHNTPIDIKEVKYATYHSYKRFKNTGEISNLCHEANEPIYITKNGYGDMVIMNIKIFEERMFMQDVYCKIEESENDVSTGRTKNAKESLKRVREKYSV